jgi:myo-inositol-1(or 4)-monophosphatase
MEKDLDLARKAAVQAGKVILKYYKSDYEIKEKSYHNPVTTADHASDEVLKNILLNERSQYGWLSEETVDSPDRLTKEYVWVVDPIDGTKEFIEGVPNFVVSIGLVQNGNPILGVLFNPVTKEIFTGLKNSGAYLNGEKINCNKVLKISDMAILNSRSESKRGLWDRFNNTFGSLKAVGSVAYKLGLIAAGKSDIFASLRPKNEWDICAGNCIINEAGGKLIDLNGKQRKYNQINTLITPGLIAGNKSAVDKTLNILKEN